MCQQDPAFIFVSDDLRWAETKFGNGSSRNPGRERDEAAAVCRDDCYFVGSMEVTGKGEDEEEEKRESNSSEEEEEERAAFILGEDIGKGEEEEKEKGGLMKEK